LMLGGHAYALRTAPSSGQPFGFQQGAYLAFVGHFFLFFVAVNPEWASPPWPLLGSLAVVTLATSATSLAARTPALHATGVIAAAVVVLGWALAAAGDTWARVALVANEAVLVYGLVWLPIAGRAHGISRAAAMG